MSNPESLVYALVKKLGIEATAFENGVCTIQFDAHMMNFQADAEQNELRCFLRIADIPADAEARMSMYRLLLMANAVGRRTGGGQMGIDDRETFVVFSHAFSAANMTVERLEAIVETLLNLTEEIQRELAEISVPGPATPPLMPAGMRV